MGYIIVDRIDTIMGKNRDDEINGTRWKKKSPQRDGFTSNRKMNRKTRLENPKNIPLFENLYEILPTDPFISKAEGMTSMNDQDPAQNSCDQDNGWNEFGNTVEGDADITLDNLKKGASKISTKPLGLGISNMFAKPAKQRSIINNGLNAPDTEDDGTLVTPKDLSVTFRPVMKQIKGALKSVLRILKGLFERFFATIETALGNIQYFILYFNVIFDKLITNISEGLTSGQAGQMEIDTFKQQATQLVTLFFVWIFVYNWYYVIVFMEPEKRFTFDPNWMSVIPFLYDFLGPSCAVVEWLNYFIVTIPSDISRWLIGKWEIFRKILFILFFFVFFILVAADFQSQMLLDFFSSLSIWKFYQSIDWKSGGPTILLAIVAFIVGCTGFNVVFFKENAIRQFCMDLFEGGVFGIAIGFIAFLVYMFIYMIYLGMVSIPVGYMLFSFYLVAYSFFGILVYEQFNVFDAITALSVYVSTANPVPGNMCDSTEYSGWFGWIIHKIREYFNTTISFVLKNIFEILILLSLLGGISIYVANFKSVFIEKSVSKSAGLYSGPVKMAFNNLYTWLIIINVLLIVILVLFMVYRSRQTSLLEKYEKQASVSMNQMGGSTTGIVNVLAPPVATPGGPPAATSGGPPAAPPAASHPMATPAASHPMATPAALPAATSAARPGGPPTASHPMATPAARPTASPPALHVKNAQNSPILPHNAMVAGGGGGSH